MIGLHVPLTPSTPTLSRTGRPEDQRGEVSDVLWALGLGLSSDGLAGERPESAQLSHHALWPQAVAYTADGELAEVMLKSIRPRRRPLNPNARKRAQRAAAAE
jgi:hypothetical protein